MEEIQTEKWQSSCLADMGIRSQWHRQRRWGKETKTQTEAETEINSERQTETDQQKIRDRDIHRVTERD